MKRLNDFKIIERTPRPAIKVLPMQFGDDEATRRIASCKTCHLSALGEEIQKLACK